MDSLKNIHLNGYPHKFQYIYTLGAETFANFAQIRESLGREKFYIDRFAKVYARKIFQFFLFFTKLVGCP